MVSIGLGGDEQVVPCRDGEIYVLRREPTREPGYQLVQQGTNKTLLQIRYEGQVSSKESKPGSVSLYKIAGLQGSVTPDYIDGNIFIFHDRQRYFVIKNWQTPESMPALIDGLAVSGGSRLSFKGGAAGMTMLYSDAVSGRTAIFRVNSIVEKIREFPPWSLPQPLLAGTDRRTRRCSAIIRTSAWNWRAIASRRATVTSTTISSSRSSRCWWTWPTAASSSSTTATSSSP